MIINRIGSLGQRGTVDVQVGASADDGHWDTSVFGSNYEHLLFGKGIANINFFARWTGINIPADAIIIDATVYLYVEQVDGTVSGSYLYFNDAAAPTAPTTVSTANGKTKTTENVACNPSGTDTWEMYDVKAIIEELLASYTSYSSGAMMAIGIGAGSNSNYATLHSYDHVGTQNAPRLVINWRR